MDGHHQQVQLLALPWRGSFATTMSPQPIDEALVADMCPALYRAVRKGRVKDVTALLLHQHGAMADDQATDDDEDVWLGDDDEVARIRDDDGEVARIWDSDEGAQITDGSGEGARTGEAMEKIHGEGAQLGHGDGDDPW
ncbi:hypothetical protein EJB05_28720, partial [Eragrostis curvula]